MISRNHLKLTTSEPWVEPNPPLKLLQSVLQNLKRDVVQVLNNIYNIHYTTLNFEIHRLLNISEV